MARPAQSSTLANDPWSYFSREQVTLRERQLVAPLQTSTAFKFQESSPAERLKSRECLRGHSEVWLSAVTELGLARVALRTSILEFRCAGVCGRWQTRWKYSRDLVHDVTQLNMNYSFFNYNCGSLLIFALRISGSFKLIDSYTDYSHLDLHNG